MWVLYHIATTYSPKMNWRNLSWCLGLLLVGVSCQKNNRVEVPPVAHLREEVQIVRFGDLLMTSSDSAQLMSKLEEHPVFSEVFLNQVLSSYWGQSGLHRVQHFRSDSLTAQLWSQIDSLAPFSASAKADLELAFALAKHYFPDFQAPTVFTCFSKFEVGSFTIGPEILGIGLDFFLGPNYPYDPILFPEYIARTMTPDHLAGKSVQVLVEAIVGDHWGPSLSDQMLRNGLVLYIKKRLLPYTADTIIHEFTSEELDWVENNERDIWAFFVSEELLHETNRRKIKKLISPSPSVPGMPEQAPGRVGNWVGYRIIESFVRNQNLTPSQLLEERDAEKILAKSRYRPRQ
ncbi:MAG: hypothetical protein KTR24_08670 [Saprospiraceae bacterium]|nr:hypothetical protein [Saprospiraceae bacterium]